jgi:hypothetical protein
MNNGLYVCLLFLSSIFNLLGCSAQNRPAVSQQKKDTMYIPKITKDFEKFDMALYNRLEKKSVDRNEWLPDGRYIQVFDLNDTYVYRESHKDSYFQIVKTFYKNGNIKTKGLEFNTINLGTFSKGIWYQFDEQGKLIKEIDYDKDFTFGFNDVVAFCTKENISLKTGVIKYGSGMHTYITRTSGSSSSPSEWIVKWLKLPDVIEEIRLNGTTGSIISRTEMEYQNN